MAFSVLAGRLFYLHVWIGQELAQKAQLSRERITIQEAPRGDIVDIHGNLLATTVFTRTLGVDPSVVREEDLDKLPQLSTLINVPVDELKEKFAPGEIKRQEGSEIKFIKVQWRKLAEGIKEDLYEEILALGIKGVRGDKTFQRQYPGQELAAHIIGYLYSNNKPVNGVEHMMDFYLRGQRGWQQSEKDAKRREMPQFRQREVEPTPGLRVQLTIDSYVQHVAEEELRLIKEKYDPDGATVIISRPATGDLLALANYPTFDLNNYRAYSGNQLRNRAVMDIYEPGSVFKIVPVSAALEENAVGLYDLFDCSRSEITFKDRVYRLPGETHKFDKLDIKGILVKSSNRGAAQVGILLGQDKLYKYARRFGFGERTGWPLNREEPGLLRPTNKWTPGMTITRMPMGHEIGVTPLQTHYAMSVIANDGILMEPKFIDSVRDENNLPVVQFAPQAKQRVISGTVAEVVSSFLKEVVGEEGTAEQVFIPNYEVAGKTGTTQKFVDGRYSNQHHVASFSGFFPASRPEVVITVVIDEPKFKGIGYGGTVAGPSFKRIAEKLIPHLGIAPVQFNDDGLAWTTK